MSSTYDRLDKAIYLAAAELHKRREEAGHHMYLIDANTSQFGHDYVVTDTAPSNPRDILMEFDANGTILMQHWRWKYNWRSDWWRVYSVAPESLPASLWRNVGTFGEMVDAASHVIFCAADDCRPIHHGVWLWRNPDGTLAALATDGYRMTLYNVQCAPTTDTAWFLTVPMLNSKLPDDAVIEAVRGLTRANGTVDPHGSANVDHMWDIPSCPPLRNTLQTFTFNRQDMRQLLGMAPYNRTAGNTMVKFSPDGTASLCIGEQSIKRDKRGKFYVTDSAKNALLTVPPHEFKVQMIAPMPERTNSLILDAAYIREALDTVSTTNDQVLVICSVDPLKMWSNTEFNGLVTFITEGKAISILMPIGGKDSTEYVDMLSADDPQAVAAREAIAATVGSMSDYLALKHK